MEHEIINTGDYLLIVDDSEIKGGDWYIDLNLKQIFSKSNPQISKIEWQKKIIAHLPLNNSPILEGVDLLPPFEDEVEKKLNENCNPKIAAIMIKGYNKAKEKYKYTEEDLKDIWKYVKNNRVTYEEYLQSLQQPKMPVGFKREFLENKLWGQKGTGVYITETNSQGLTQWVGEWIY
jgi:hypothetical protein